MSLFDEAKKKIKELSYDKLPFRYGESYVKLSDVLAVLGDLQKTHILVSNDKICQLLSYYQCRTYPDCGSCEVLEELVGEKQFEKLLEAKK